MPRCSFGRYCNDTLYFVAYGVLCIVLVYSTMYWVTIISSLWCKFINITTTVASCTIWVLMSLVGENLVPMLPKPPETYPTTPDHNKKIACWFSILLANPIKGHFEDEFWQFLFCYISARSVTPNILNLTREGNIILNFSCWHLNYQRWKLCVLAIIRQYQEFAIGYWQSWILIAKKGAILFWTLFW